MRRSTYEQDTSVSNLDIPAFLRQPPVAIKKENSTKTSTVLVIGVGGAGVKYVEHLAVHPIDNVSSIIADTHYHDSAVNAVATYLLGEDKNSDQWVQLINRIRRHHAVVINVGLGGKSGSRLVTMIAKFIQEEGIVPVVHCTMPSRLEGFEKMKRADMAISELILIGCYALKHDNELMDQYEPSRYGVKSGTEIVYQLFDQEITLLAPITKQASKAISYQEIKYARC